MHHRRPSWSFPGLQALAAYVREIFVAETRVELEQWVADGSITRSELPDVLAERTEPSDALVVPQEPSFDELRWFRGRRMYLENCAS